jgi:hypothetical protein
MVPTTGFDIQQKSKRRHVFREEQKQLKRKMNPYPKSESSLEGAWLTAKIPMRNFIKQVILPPVVLAGIDMVAGVALYGHTSGLWLFTNTNSWSSVAATLAFTEGVLCIIIGAVTGWGGQLGGQRTIVVQESSGAEAAHKKYVEDQKKNMNWGFRLIANGIMLIFLTMIIGLA